MVLIRKPTHCHKVGFGRGRWLYCHIVTKSDLLVVHCHEVGFGGQTGGWDGGYPMLRIDSIITI